MSLEIHILASDITLESTDSSYVYSDKKPGAGYHNTLSALHTLFYDVDSFVGSIKIQGTLELDPSDADWFDITGSEIGAGNDSSVWTTANSINFSGNFVWLRAGYNVQNGTIRQIAFSF